MMKKKLSSEIEYFPDFVRFPIYGGDRADSNLDILLYGHLKFEYGLALNGGLVSAVL